MPARKRGTRATAPAEPTVQHATNAPDALTGDLHGFAKPGQRVLVQHYAWDSSTGLPLITDSAEYTVADAAPGFAFPHPDPRHRPVTRADLLDVLVRLSAELRQDAVGCADMFSDAAVSASLTLSALSRALSTVAGDLSDRWQQTPPTEPPRPTVVPSPARED